MYWQDVIKSRLQGDGWGAAARYTGPAHCLRLTVQVCPLSSGCT